jgi:tryptophan 2,3-dioxygenase
MSIINNYCVSETKHHLNYGTYLCIDELLSLQKLRSTNQEHDELLFIIVHQVYELWFKQIIHECVRLRYYLYNKVDHQILLTLKRVRNILKVMVLQTDILETMGPISFASFRKYLGKASGFQSFQFRLFEFILGFKDERFLNNRDFTNKQRKVLEIVFKESSIWLEFLSYFKNSIADNKLHELFPHNTDLNDDHRALIFIYLNPSIYTEIAELVLDIDEGLQEWRYRHVKMVERIIGVGKIGTGGSSGVEYLKCTLFKTFCPELLYIRNYF